MNINANSYFSTEPSVHIQRSVFSRPSERTFTGDVGVLIPFYIDEVLPGSTVKIKTSKVIRLQTPLSPFMGNIVADFSWWYCPNNILWTHWNECMGENTASKWIPQQSYSTPKAGFSNGSSYVFPKGSIADYLGLPTEFQTGAVNALPFRMYHKLWNEFWRDQNVQDPVLLSTGDSQSSWTDDITYYLYDRYVMPRPVNRFHDYFSSCTPGPQKSADVRIPSGLDLLQVGTTADTHAPISNPRVAEIYQAINASTATFGLYNNSNDARFNGASSLQGYEMEPLNLWAVLGDSAMGTINDLRLAFQIEKLYTRDMLAGSRYAEILAAHFGTVAPDATLYRPQYLGGNRVNINVSQVLNNAASSGEYLGDLGAFSQTVDVHADFTHSFTQHGLIMGCMCLRYMHVYSQGREKIWDRSDRFSYYWPELAHISFQPVYKKELYGDATDPDYDDVFGYQEAWAEYRYKPSYVAGEMRPGQSFSFDSWSLADYYSNCPTLSDSWLRESKSNVDRVLAVTSSAANQFWADIFIENISTLPMPVRSIPGLADHF